MYWHRVKEYLDALPVGTLLADVGSGDGKYFGVNPGVVTIGKNVVVIVICVFYYLVVGRVFLYDILCSYFLTSSCCVGIDCTYKDAYHTFHDHFHTLFYFRCTITLTQVVTVL